MASLAAVVVVGSDVLDESSLSVRYGASESPAILVEAVVSDAAFEVEEESSEETEDEAATAPPSGRRGDRATRCEVRSSASSCSACEACWTALLSIYVPYRSACTAVVLLYWIVY